MRCPSLLDVFSALFISSVILIHLSCAPYTKIEESFSIQATHDVLAYGFPLSNASRTLSLYDHVTYPGNHPVSRSFIGPIVLAGISSPVVRFWNNPLQIQVLARAILGLFNAFSLLSMRRAVNTAYGRMAANFYILLQASQFHIIYYASRPLPNMFAFGLSTFALSNLLLTKSTNSKSKRASRRLKLALYLLTITGIVFRSEVALLLLAEVLYILFRRRSTFVQTLTNDIIPAGVAGAVIGLLLTIPLDTYMWSTYPRLHWPEFSAFWFNTIEGKSSDWGTSPWYFYFTSALPRLLLNPLTWMLCIPSAIAMPGTRRTSIDVLIPSLFYVVLYSILPHKETRFVMYIIPSLTAIASAGSGYIFTRRFKSPLYYLLTLLLLLSIATSFAISTFLLALSSLNYPGGLAMQSLHHLLSNTTTILPPPGSPTPSSISIYTDNLSFQTGAIRFLEIPQPPSALTSLTATTEEGSPWNARNIKVYYDKTDEKFYPELLRSVEFWDRFDFALMERPEKAIGAWEVLDTIYAYRGIEFTKGQGQDEEKGMDAMVRDGVPFLLGDTVLLKGWRMLEGLGRRVTGGRWVRIRMEPRIRVLRRQRGAT